MAFNAQGFQYSPMDFSEKAGPSRGFLEELQRDL